MVIYKITNDVNSKVYIGQTCKPLDERIAGHRNAMVSGVSTHLYRAMRKYGWDKFHFEQIATAQSKSELDELEIYYIDKYNSISAGYNMAPGGYINVMSSAQVKAKHDAIMRSPEVRNKISQTMKDRYKRNPVSEATKKKLSDNKKAFYASPEGQAVKEKWKKSYKLSPEHYQALNSAKHKAVYCINTSGSIVANFESVKEAAEWWYASGYCVKDASQLCDKIKESSKYDKFIKGLKWIYRV